MERAGPQLGGGVRAPGVLRGWGCPCSAAGGTGGVMGTHQDVPGQTYHL